MIKKVVMGLATIALLQGCTDTGSFHSKWQAFTESETLTWAKSDVRTFEFDVKEIGNYNVSLGVRHVEGFPYTTIPVSLSIKGEGVDQTDKYAITVVENDAYLGEVGFDLYDREEVIIKAMNFPAVGKYSFVVSHEFPTDPVSHIMEVGLILEKAS